MYSQEELNICHLYPKHMSLYGDRGNILFLKYLAEKSNIKVNIQDCSPNQEINKNNNIILLGGGQDQDQELIKTDLLKRKQEILNLVSAGAIFLGICGGFQLLGKSYETSINNQIEGLNFFDFKTITAKPNQKRIIGNVIAQSEEFGILTGYENHGGRTFLEDKNLKPLATIIQGGGNNNLDKTEGLFVNYNKGIFLGTYLHGFLPKNIQISIYLLKKLKPNFNFNFNSLIYKINYQNNLKLKY